MPRSSRPAPVRKVVGPSIVGCIITGLVLVLAGLALVLLVAMPLFAEQAAAGAVQVEQYANGPSRQVPAYGAWGAGWCALAAVLWLLAIVSFHGAVSAIRQR